MNGNVFYCINRGSVTTLGHGGNGGIFGILNGNLSNALNTGTIKNNDTHFGEHDADASGIVGTLSGKVERCINKGNVSSAMRYAGGIVQATSSGTITECLNMGNVTNNRKYTRAWGGTGGILGSAASYDMDKNKYGTSNVTISYCGNTGKVTGSDMTGGVLGRPGPKGSNKLKYVYTTAKDLVIRGSSSNTTLSNYYRWDTKTKPSGFYTNSGYKGIENEGKWIFAWQIKPTIFNHPYDYIGNIGDTAKLDVQTHGANLTYQWYVSDSKEGTYTKIGNGWTTETTQSVLNVKVEETDKWYKCEVIGIDENGTRTTLMSDPALVGPHKRIIEKLDKPQIIGTYTYNGLSQTANILGYDSIKMTIEGNKGINAGEYTVVIRIIDKDVCEWTDGTNGDIVLTWKINPKSVNVIWGEQSTFVYDGALHAPTASVDGGVEGETLNISQTKERNVGKYVSTVTLTGVTGGQQRKENYVLTENTRAYEITKATGTYDMTIPDNNPSKSEGQGIVEGNNTPTTDENGVARYKYKVTLVAGNSISMRYKYNGDISGKVEVNTGIATITVGTDNVTIKGISEGQTTGKISYVGSNNYKDVIVEIAITVLRANYSIERNGQTTYYNKLQDAVDNTVNGDRIEVLQDVEDKGKVEIGDKNVTLDLNDKKVTKDAEVHVGKNGKLKIDGDKGKKGTLENTNGPAVKNEGELTLGTNKGTDNENEPYLKGKDNAVESENGTFKFESGTLIGKNFPPYTGTPKVPKCYYIVTTQESDGYHSTLKHDVIPPELYTDPVGDMVIGTSDEVYVIVNVKDEDSGIEIEEFTIEDLIFEVEGEVVEPTILDLTFMNESKGIYRYALRFGGIKKGGELKIRVERNKIYDRVQLGNAPTILIDGQIIINNTPIDMKDIELKLIDPEDGVTEDGKFVGQVEGVKENSGIDEYRWEIRKKGTTNWNILGTEIEKYYTGKLEEEGKYEIRVRVSDKYGNYGYTNIVEITYEKNTEYNSKPTIEFEKEYIKKNEKITAVKIHAMIKSSSKIVKVSVNGMELSNGEITKNVVEEGKYQINTKVGYIAYNNMSYKFSVTDENGNISLKVINISEITISAAKILYKIENATIYGEAKIIFKSDEDIMLYGDLPEGYEEMKEGYRNTYQKEIEIKVPSGTKEINKEFKFINNVGSETTVQVKGKVDTEIRYVRLVSKKIKEITTVYGGQIDLDIAMNLVSKMKTAKTMVKEEIRSYYEIDTTKINMLVTSEEELNTAKRLGKASKIQILTGEGIKDLSKGESEIITILESGISASVNDNLTGVYIRNNNLVTRDKKANGESFHVTIVNK